MEAEISLADLHSGLSRGEFIYYYQPIFSLVNGRICGAEALLRWRRPDGTLRSPAAFIPLAEETGFITELTRAMYPRLIADLECMAPSEHLITTYLNLCSHELESDHLALEIGESLAKTGCQPRCLGVEIVERVLMPPNARIRNSIYEIAEQGLPLVLNDFSAGNTTLNYLSQLPLSAIKLAMNIVQRAPLSRMDFRVMRHLVSMGHQLRLDVIAEGIENDELYNLTLSTGCSAAQGYLFSYPLPLEEFCALVEQKPRWTNYPFGLEYLAQIDHIDFRRDVIRGALTLYTTSDADIRQRALERLPLLGVDECLLAEWYNGIGQEWNTQPGFAELGQVHAEFHATAIALIQAAQDQASLERIDALIDNLDKLSTEIMRHVQKFAIAGLRQHYRLGKAFAGRADG